MYSKKYLSSGKLLAMADPWKFGMLRQEANWNMKYKFFENISIVGYHRFSYTILEPVFKILEPSS